MAFDIAFIPAHDPYVRHGRIELGGFSELFEASLDYWASEDYEQQWIEGISRVVEDSADSCLMSSVTDPLTANFLLWWPIYVEGETAIFQNCMLLLDQPESAFDLTAPFRPIRPRETTSDSGRRVSEWMVPIRELGEWLEAHR